MEFLQVKDHKENNHNLNQGQSSRYMQSQQFIPPTHPAYVVSSAFEASHITQLQQECDKNYIAIGMQTSKKKLMKMPEMPTDKYFIVVDDSLGKPILEGEFLILNSKIVYYPISNSLKQVIQEFKDYIGLGHYQTTEEIQENGYKNESNNQNRKIQVLHGNINLPINEETNVKKSSLIQNSINNVSQLGANSKMGRSKIQLRQVSSRKQQLKIGKGKLFIYDNRKDSVQFKTFISQLKSEFSSFYTSICFINRIDEYNCYCNQNKQTDNIVFMSQFSFLYLMKYFQKSKSVAILADDSQKLPINVYSNLVLYTSSKERVVIFVRQFAVNKSNLFLQQKKVKQELGNQLKSQIGIKQLTPSPFVSINDNLPSSAQQKLQNKQKPDFVKQQADKNKIKHNQNIALKPNEQKIEYSRLQIPEYTFKNNNQKIKFIKITDIDKDMLKKIKENPNYMIESSNIPQLSKQNKQPIVFQNQNNQKLNQICKNNVPLIINSPILSNLTRLNAQKEGDILSQKSSVSKNSKVKRLNKSNKRVSRLDIQKEEQQQVVQPKNICISQVDKTDKKRSPSPKNSLVNSHLRMGSDNQKCRGSMKRQKPTHHRVKSDEKKYIPYSVFDNTLGIGLNVNIPSQEQDDMSQIQKQNKQPALIRELGQPFIERQLQNDNEEQNMIRVLKPKINSAKQTNKYEDLKINHQQQQEDEQGIFIRRPNRKQPVKEEFKDNNWKVNQNHQDKLYAELCLAPDNIIFQGSQHYRPITYIKNIHISLQEIELGSQVSSFSENTLSNIIQFKGFQTKEQALAQQIISKCPLEDSKVFDKSQPSSIRKTGQSNPSNFIPEPNQELKQQTKRFSFGLKNKKPNFNQQQNIPTLSNKFKLPKANAQGLHQYQISSQSQKTLRQPAISEVSNSGEKVFSKNNGSSCDKRSSISNKKVNKIFNKYKQKAAIEYISNKRESKSRQEPSQMSLSKNNFEIGQSQQISQRSRKIDPQKVGKIYTNVKCKGSDYVNSRVDSPLNNENDYYFKDRTNYKQQIKQKTTIPAKLNCEYFPNNYPKKQQITSWMSPGSSYQKYQLQPNQNIQNIIDLSKYQKCIENGLVVYRSKFPTKVIQSKGESGIKLYPEDYLNQPKEKNLYDNNKSLEKSKSGLLVKSIPFQNISETKGGPQVLKQINFKDKSKMPILSPAKSNNQLDSIKQNFKNYQPVKEKTKYVGPFIQQNVGVQCQTDCFNSLVCMNNINGLNSYSDNLKENIQKSKEIMKPITNQMSNKKNIPKSPKKNIIKNKDQIPPKYNQHKNIQSIQSPLNKPNPITSQQFNFKQFKPVPLRQNVSDLISEQNDSQNSELQTLVLYLADKFNYQKNFQQISKLKKTKDSLITFKNDKQLCQQILQTINIFNLVYIFISDVSVTIEKLLQNYPNCFIVKKSGDKTKIKGNVIYVEEIKHLEGVTDLLLQQFAAQRKKMVSNISENIAKTQKSTIQNGCYSSVYYPTCQSGHCCCKANRCHHQPCS